MADKTTEYIPPSFAPTPTTGSQTEALTRPEIGGKGQGPRQRELNEKIGADNLSPEVIQARKEFDAGKISLEEFNRRTGTH